MVKLLKKDRIKFLLIAIFVSSFCTIVLAGKRGPDNDMIATLTSANYICLIMNNLYIYYMYTRAKKIKSIFDKILTRIGQNKFFNSYIINFILDILVYFIILMLPLYIKLGIDFTYKHIFIIYLTLNFANFIIQEVISMLILILPKGNKLIVIPIFMNFCFHYFLIAYIVNSVFGL